jgi:DNA replication protein DnaC
MNNIESQIRAGMKTFEDFIAEAPDIAEDYHAKLRPARDLEYKTRFPLRYREEWEIPEDQEWVDNFTKIKTRIKNGGIVALIGNRGHGKTRFAAEVARDLFPSKSQYTTAMELFLRLRNSFRKDSTESEREIVNELSQCKLLVIDELQERGNTEWEDRILVHIIDKRYGSMIPTILIANLTTEKLTENLGDSISSRMNEGGGIITIKGKSHRV